MKTILQTTRFILKEFSAEDSEGFYKMNLDVDVLKFTGDKPFNSIKETEDFINNYDHYKKFGFGRWTIIEKITGNYIGWCGLKYSEELNEIDIGFRISKKYWGNGIATETAKAVLQFAFIELNIKTVLARVIKENIASRKVIEKLGMKFRNSFTDELGEWLIYEISAKQLK